MTSIKKLEDLWLMNAAGMVKTVEDMRPLVRAPITHIVIGGMTVEVRIGNPEPNFWAAPDGRWALNSRGLPNRGLEYYKKHLGPMFELAQRFGKELVLNFSSSLGFDDWVAIATVAAAYPDVILEINVSCPNKWHDGVNETLIAENPQAVETIVETVHSVAPRNPLWVKLPPYKAPRTNPILRQMCVMLGTKPYVHALVSCNTLGGQKPPVVDGKPVISMPTAGMSGARIKPWALLQNRVIGELLPRMPRIGVGGIRSGRDVEDYRLSGVSGVAIGTEFFKTMDPRIFSHLWEEATV